MPAEIPDSVRSRDAPHVSVFADHVVNPSALAHPVSVIPGTANRGHVGQPRRLAGEFLQLLVIAELPGAAGPVQDEKLVFTAKLAVLPVAIHRPNVADVGCDSGNSSPSGTSSKKNSISSS